MRGGHVRGTGAVLLGLLPDHDHRQPRPPPAAVGEAGEPPCAQAAPTGPEEARPRAHALHREDSGVVGSTPGRITNLERALGRGLTHALHALPPSESAGRTPSPPARGPLRIQVAGLGGSLHGDSADHDPGATVAGRTPRVLGSVGRLVGESNACAAVCGDELGSDDVTANLGCSLKAPRRRGLAIRRTDCAVAAAAVLLGLGRASVAIAADDANAAEGRAPTGEVRTPAKAHERGAGELRLGAGPGVFGYEVAERGSDSVGGVGGHLGTVCELGGALSPRWTLAAAFISEHSFASSGGDWRPRHSLLTGPYLGTNGHEVRGWRWGGMAGLGWSLLEDRRSDESRTPGFWGAGAVVEVAGDRCGRARTCVGPWGRFSVLYSVGPANCSATPIGGVSFDSSDCGPPRSMTASLTLGGQFRYFGWR